MIDAKPKVYLAGQDHVNWAHDEGLRHARLALKDFVEFSSLEEANVVHSTWWRGVMQLPREQLRGKRIISYTADDVFLRIISDPDHLAARRLIGLWVARNRREMEEFATLGIRSVEIPLMVDVSTFRPLGADDPEVAEVRRAWGIPSDRYLIGSFQRDTEGRDLVTPKLKKGPDIFAQIVWDLWRRRLPIHVVLTGPRRFWLMKRLAEFGVPFTFVGQRTEEGRDDIRINAQPRSLLNLLYNLVDLYLVASRDEGAPNAVLEAPAAGCRIVSTPVGTAPGVLEPVCIYRSVPEAVELIACEIRERFLATTVEANRKRILDLHTPEAVAPLFRAVYERLEAIPPAEPVVRRVARVVDTGSLLGRVVRWVLPLVRPRAHLVVSMWNRYYPPPYGGANQFMRALSKALEQRGVRVVENTPRADVHILQAIGFNVRWFRRCFARTPMRVIHRLVGPVHLYRGFDRDKDEETFRLNRECATATVVQSVWSLEQTVKMGYRPVNPVLIYNASDPGIFNRNGKLRFSRDRKIRLVTSSWSPNPRKGGPLYKFLDHKLDWTRFEYTFVGRASEQFDNIRVIPPVPTREVAEIMRQHDIYITASQNDTSSNALIEALSCGLPALYLHSGGNPELVGHGGLAFHDESDVLEQMETLVEHYETFEALVAPPTMERVADQYLMLIDGVYRGEWVSADPIDVLEPRYP